MTTTMSRIHKAWPSVSVIVALACIYFAERVFSTFDGLRLSLAVLGAAGLLAAVGTRYIEFAGASAEKKPVLRRLFLTTFGVVVAMGLYALIPLVFSGEGASQERTRGVITVAYWVILSCSTFGLGAIELAVYSVAQNPSYEHRRIDSYFQRGVSAGLLLCCVFLLNFIGHRHEAKADLSFGKKALASPATKKLINELTKPVGVTIFYPSANEVGEAIMTYFDSLKGSPKLSVTRTDQALAGKKAREAGVNENGYIGVTQEKNNEKIRVGLKLRSSRSALKSLDSNFAKALIKVTRQKKTVYFTVGHNERRTDPISDDKRPGLRKLKKLLTNNQYTVKTLGLGEGLGSELPTDGFGVFIMGPEKPFLPEEIGAVKEAIKKGTKLLIALEADVGGEDGPEGLDEILAELGLKFDKTILANDRGAALRVTRTKADAEYIVSNRYSSHESVTTMTRYSDKLYTAFAKTGYLEKLDKLPSSTRVDMVLNAMSGTFGDKDRDHVYDKATEKRKTYGLVAAVTRTASATETRAVVVSDVDVLADTFFRNDGNQILLADLATWIADIKDPVVPKVTAEDVRIQHRRDEDILWFYSTTLGVPLLVLMYGVFFVGRRRRR